MGVTVESQAHLIRARRLLRVPAAVRFLSVEPLLETVALWEVLGDATWDHDQHEQIVERRGIDWVIVGGESGPHARPCELDWLRALRDQCQIARVPFFLKQLGGWPDKRGHEKALLDGRLWRQMPPHTALIEAPR